MSLLTGAGYGPAPSFSASVQVTRTHKTTTTSQHNRSGVRFIPPQRVPRYGARGSDWPAFEAETATRFMARRARGPSWASGGRGGRAAASGCGPLPLLRPDSQVSGAAEGPV